MPGQSRANHRKRHAVDGPAQGGTTGRHTPIENVSSKATQHNGYVAPSAIAFVPGVKGVRLAILLTVDLEPVDHDAGGHESRIQRRNLKQIHAPEETIDGLHIQS